MKAMKLQGVEDDGTWPRFHQKGPGVKNALKAFAAASALALFSLPAQASIFTATMLGANENPANASTATGFTTVALDDVADTLKVDVTFSGLTGGAAAAGHIHCCVAPGGNAPVAVPFTGFPASTGGTYSHLFDLTNPAIYRAAFLALGGGTAEGAEALLIDGLFDGEAYSNIHNATFGGGEIRGLLAAVPEPATLALFGSGLLGLGFARRKTKTHLIA